MYAKQTTHRGGSISVPHNYSGNAFSDQGDIDAPLLDSPEQTFRDSELAVESCTSPEKDRKSFLPINIGSEELLLVGLIILLFQSGSDDSLTPLLLILLLFGGF